MKNLENFGLDNLDKKIECAYRQYRGYVSYQEFKIAHRWFTVYEWLSEKKKQRLSKIFGS